MINVTESAAQKQSHLLVIVKLQLNPNSACGCKLSVVAAPVSNIASNLVLLRIPIKYLSSTD